MSSRKQHDRAVIQTMGGRKLMRTLTLWLMLVTAVLAGQTYQLVGSAAAASGTLEVWNADVDGKAVVVLKVKETVKPGEVNFVCEMGSVFDVQARCEELLKDRTQLKPDSVHVVSTLESGESSIDFATVRFGKSDAMRLLVVKSGGNERSFLLDKQNWPDLRKLLKKAVR